jgi:hypothetical protein
MLAIDPDLVAVVALVTAGVVVVLLVVVTVVALRLRKLRSMLVQALGGQGHDLVAVLGRHDAELAGATASVDELTARTDELRELVRGSVSRVGLVRYDAFDDMGGALSFSAALLDERGDGLVISAINGRTETRCYGKTLSAGGGDHVSDEEQAAIDAAIEGRAPVVLPTEGRRRRRRSA